MPEVSAALRSVDPIEALDLGAGIIERPHDALHGDPVLDRDGVVLKLVDSHDRESFDCALHDSRSR